MLLLIGIGVIRGVGDFDPARPLTWIFAAGFVALVGGSAVVYARMEALRRARRVGTVREHT
jgi:hypothetical protein